MRVSILATVVAGLTACSSSSPTQPGNPPVNPVVGKAGINVTTVSNGVLVFPLTASGDVAPTRRIVGASTGLSLPIGVAVDSKGSVYVAIRTGSRITVYPLGADGNLAPTRSLIDTAMKSPQAIFIDKADAVFAVSCPNCGNAAGGATGMFHFANGSNAIDYFLRGTNTGMTVPVGVGVDGSNNIFIGNAFGASMNVYAPGASGNTLPIRSLNPGASQNVQSLTVSGTTIVLSSPSGGMLTYLTTSTNSSAAATIGSSTTFPLSYPGGVYLDTSVPQPVLYVVDYAGNAIYVAQTAGAAPNLSLQSVATIKGAATGLISPLSLTVVR